ncbi:dnaJ homolog subfamily C member 30, mitochondrial [Cloeon dipterum]|uniref:dnaJ homolog subfamily C member 30, mitochondrial n=1 Tax=Cloeon dipterum TaxID=197152 RepID=UPI0032201124
MQVNAKTLAAWSCHQCVLPRKLFSQTQRMIASSAGKKTHYDSLGVAPTASQGEIKNAYYKLSKVYHPDRNKGSQEAADKFRQITEAYETVGNVQKRRMYDKGGLFETHVDMQETEEQKSVSKFYKSRGMTYTGKTPIYDFDEWSREHYGRTFARREKAKERHQSKINLNMNVRDHNESLTFMLLVAFSAMIFGGLLGMSGKEDIDRVSDKQKHNNKKG